jgi:hypothetical protein
MNPGYASAHEVENVRELCNQADSAYHYAGHGKSPTLLNVVLLEGRQSAGAEEDCAHSHCQTEDRTKKANEGKYQGIVASVFGLLYFVAGETVGRPRPAVLCPGVNGDWGGFGEERSDLCTTVRTVSESRLQSQPAFSTNLA